MNAMLTNFEWITLQMIQQAAEHGKPAPSNLDIEMELDVSSSSIAPMIIQSLERKGIIEVVRYQRAREITILATGQTTARDPLRKSNRMHVPRGAGSASGKLAKASRRMR
jgi:Mn-dependent DtxR family transcriptional regulator